LNSKKYKMVTYSNVNNKYIAAKETAYGESPAPFTSVDFGHIQSITLDEEENVTKERGINSGHTAALFEDGLYWVNTSIKILVTKASLPFLLELMMGSKTDDGTDYTIVSDNEVSNSYSIKLKHTATDIVLINGFDIKDWSIEGAKGESVSITLNGISKKATTPAETLTVTKNTDKIFKDLDMSVTVGGNSFVLNNFSIVGNWNVTDDEGRGIEAVSAGERRLIQRVIKHGFDVSGSYEAEVDDNTEFGYVEERSDEVIVFTLNRGTDNEHVFTMSNTRSGGRGMERNNEKSKVIISYDYEALDISVLGDL